MIDPRAANTLTPERLGKLLYTKEEAAEILSLGVRTLHRMIVFKEIPVRRIGRRVRIEARALESFSRRDHPVTSKSKREIPKLEVISASNSAL